MITPQMLAGPQLTVNTYFIERFIFADILKVIVAPMMLTFILKWQVDWLI
jgi:hypothetical protein